MDAFSFNEWVAIEKAAPSLAEVEADLNANQRTRQAQALQELKRDITATIDAEIEYGNSLDAGGITAAKPVPLVTKSRAVSVLQEAYTMAAGNSKYKMLPILEELKLFPASFIKAEKFNSLLGIGTVTPADFEDNARLEKLAVKYLDKAWCIVSAGHRVAPEQTTKKIEFLHALTLLALQNNPGFAFFAGSLLEKRFRAESDENFLDQMGGSIEGLVTKFPDMAPLLSEAVAQKIPSLRTTPADTHTIQLLAAICGLTKEHELFITACLHKMRAGTGVDFSAGGQYFDTHLEQCSDSFKDRVAKVLRLQAAELAGKSGDYQKEYALLLPPLQKGGAKEAAHYKIPKPR